MENGLRRLGLWSGLTVLFAGLLALAGLAGIGLAGRAVKHYYAERAVIEAIAREHFGQPPPDYPLAAFLEALTQPSLTVTAGEKVAAAPAPLLEHGATLAGAIFAFALIGLVLSALVWVWRAHGNLCAAGLNPRYGPGKALAAYALPLVNLALAPDAMRELYNRSHAEPEELVDSPVDDVTAWWTAGIAGAVILSALVAKYMLDAVSNLAIVTPLWMEYAMASFALILLLVCAGLFARLTRVVTQAQAENLADLPASLPVPEPMPRPTVRLVERG